MQKVAWPETLWCWISKNPHIRDTRDGTMIEKDVNNRVYTMDMWIGFDGTCPVFSRQRQ